MVAKKTVVPRSPELRRTVLRFADSLMRQVTRTAACNRFHMIEAQKAARRPCHRIFSMD
jgi:hypothetical protein